MILFDLILPPLIQLSFCIPPLVYLNPYILLYMTHIKNINKIFCPHGIRAHFLGFQVAVVAAHPLRSGPLSRICSTATHFSLLFTHIWLVPSPDLLCRLHSDLFSSICSGQISPLLTLFHHCCSIVLQLALDPFVPSQLTLHHHSCSHYCQHHSSSSHHYCSLLLLKFCL